MQKFFLSAFFVFTLVVCEAQTKIGLKFSPTISTNRVNLRYESASTDTLDIENNENTFKFSLGVVLDHAFTDTYHFSTGIIYLPKRVGMTILAENGGTYPNPEEAYDLQYLQIPLTLKLFTNEILPDLSVFFQVGAAPEIKLYEEPVEEEYRLVEQFSPLDLSAILGGGLEYSAGLNTILFFDVSYQRGLLNTIKSTSVAMPDDFSIRTTSVLIDFGIKF